MSLLHDLRSARIVVGRSLRRRRARAAWAASPARSAEHPGVEALVFFPDPPVNAYQVRQWYEPMRALSQRHRVAVVTTDPETAVALEAESPLPVLWHRSVGETEEWMDRRRVGVVFYVNQNVTNFRMMRHRRPAHVFVSHGESDKDYMASNQLKAYDHTFVAGRAAEERIAGRLVDFDVERHLVRVGRPQVDVPGTGPDLPDDGRTVVLYAPTWEGDRPSMAYSSLASHGPALVDALLATGRHRLVYRPHPRTGVSDPAYAAAHRAVLARVERAGEQDPGAGHVVDTGSAYGWQLAAADACVTDVSAVAFDFLATGKPLVVTAPASPAAVMDPGGLTSLLPPLPAERAGEVVERIEAETSADAGRARAAVVERYFGDTTPGAATARFVEASSRIIEARLALYPAEATPAPDPTDGPDPADAGSDAGPATPGGPR
ncbi:CDP-glycerol glycerophosphotransferase family protein [Phycicoccus sp. BSK3Z-2]|uniref:CDP-glycerol glycerophosphotransferase family protein n=1 Tax=Phycicoccus avicenniae TaxID=2828860 RepID=A0A941D7Z3_9MICO|nr:CDP-glycerol glycerophosphotransferase family protein [Phycicoccus avicenniae]MBR7743473.1 CDP-glycerol glycerophosphotransferase family protein [Phycicoccus avicenniae]